MFCIPLLINRASLWVTVGLFLCASISTVQGQKSAIEILEEDLLLAEHDTTRMQLLYKIAYKTKNNNPQNSLRKIDDALTMAQNHKDPKFKAGLYYLRGRINMSLGNLKISHAELNRALVYYQETGNNKRIADVNNSLGGLYKVKGDFESAKTRFESALKYAKEEQDSVLIAVNYNDLGVVYFETEDCLQWVNYNNYSR